MKFLFSVVLIFLCSVHLISKDNVIEFENGRFLIYSKGLHGNLDVEINKSNENFDFKEGVAAWEPEIEPEGQLFLIKISAKSEYLLYHIRPENEGFTLKKIPLWTSIFPPLVAIILALIFKEVILSLFMGVFVGAFISSGLNFQNLFLTFFKIIDKYIVDTLIDKGHISIIVFSLLIGGMVGLISRNGGMAGIVNRLTRYAKSPRSAQFITWLLGIAIFFDDYANTLIVGNTMRSVTDKFKISREKLAYIVDSTAAPVASIAFITTWIGAELSYIADGIAGLEGFPPGSTPYSIFFSSLKYSFYPILTLLFILILILTGRDFGPMLFYEKKSKTEDNLNMDSKDHLNDDLRPVKGIPLRARNAVVPIFVVVGVTIFGLLTTGIENSEKIEGGYLVRLGLIIGNADSYKALLWASLAGVSIAFLMTVYSKIMNLEQGMNTIMSGIKTMLPAILILTFAWSLASTTAELHTATFITTALQGNIHPLIMPALIFILSVLISFSTGSSWSTMAILYPIAIPATWTISIQYGLSIENSYELVLNVIAVVMAASVMGDHISPISDTTILSSLASDCNHLNHVKTQMPYSLTVGVFAFLGAIISALFWGNWLTFLTFIGFASFILWLIVIRIGKSVE